MHLQISLFKVSFHHDHITAVIFKSQLLMHPAEMLSNILMGKKKPKQNKNKNKETNCESVKALRPKKKIVVLPSSGMFQYFKKCIACKCDQ